MRPWDFLVFLWHQWLAGISGALSVGFTAYGVFFPEHDSTKTAFLLLAIVAALLMSYQIWSNSIRHKIWFTANSRECRVTHTPDIYCRTRVESLNDAIVPQCSLSVTSVLRKTDNQELLTDKLDLPFVSFPAQPNSLIKDVRAGAPEIVDTLLIKTASMEIWPITQNWSHRQTRTLFSAGHEFILTVVATYPTGAPIRRKMLLNWTGDTSNASLSDVPEPPRGWRPRCR
jgi:hypothetical protein